MRRMSKGQHCRREQWRSDVLRAKQLPSSTRMFLVSVLAPHMKVDGWVSVPRADLADEMGVDERTITRHFTRARESGWLASVRGGHKGITAEYMASWPNAASGSQRGTTSVPLKATQRGTETNPLSRDKIVPLRRRRPASKGDTWCPALGSYVVTTAPLPDHGPTCVCDPCWSFVIFGRVRAEGVGHGLGVLELEISKSKSAETNRAGVPA